MATKATTYTVKSGDTVSQILKNLGYSDYASQTLWNQVKSLNNLDSKYTIYSGINLKLPALSGGSTAPKTTAPAPTGQVTQADARTLQPTAPQTPQELTDYLNNYQDQISSIENFDPFGGKTSGEAISEFKDKLGMEGELPTAPKYTELFTTLREAYNVDNIEAGINEYKNLIRNEELLLKQQTNYQRGQTVRMGVIEGRVDQNTRNRMEVIDWYKSNVAFLTDQANSAYSLINTMIQLNKIDYDTAKDAYQTEFNNRLNIYNSLYQQAKDERDFKYQMMMDEKKMASTNLSMYVDLISKGQLKWSSLSQQEQTQIHKMEIQAGLGMGFLSQVKPPAGSEIKQIMQRTDPVTGIGYADILYLDDKGALKTKSVKLGQASLSLAQQQALKSSGGKTTTTKVTQKETDSAFLTNSKKSGTKEYSNTILALQRYGTFSDGMKSLAQPYITEKGAYDAVSYLATTMGVSENVAYYAVEDAIKRMKMTIK